MLWPFALLVTADRVNNLHLDLDRQIQDMKISKVGGLPTRIKYFHTFGCPVYIWTQGYRMQGELAHQNGIHVLDLKSILAISLLMSAVFPWF